MNILSPVWQKRRTAFNHDWLKNQFMPALAKWVNLLDDKIEDREFETLFLQWFFSEWERYRIEAFVIAEAFEKEMSPAQLFNGPPLSQCDCDTKVWLKDLVHGLWLERYPIKQWIAEAAVCAKNADDLYVRLRQALNEGINTQSAQALHPLRNMFAEFRDRCQELARAIERLPNEVKVT